MLKRDLFGTVTLCEPTHVQLADRHVERDPGASRWWTRPVAIWLTRRELRALQRLGGIEGVPAVLGLDGHRLVRTYIEGSPMHIARPQHAAYFRDALRLIRRLHAAGVAHNDLAKEPNWLVDRTGRPALVDFQLATTSRGRGRWFRMLAHDDLRHLLKHKRTYCPEALTQRQRRVLATPSFVSRLWMRTGKPLYRFVTRRLLGWADREGAGER